MKWLGAARQQAISCAKVDPDLCRHVASLGHNELTLSIFWLLIQQKQQNFPVISMHLDLLQYVQLIQNLSFKFREKLVSQANIPQSSNHLNFARKKAVWLLCPVKISAGLTRGVVGSGWSAVRRRGCGGDWVAGRGSEAGCDAGGNWTSPAMCAGCPTHYSWIHWEAAGLQGEEYVYYVQPGKVGHLMKRILG